MNWYKAGEQQIRTATSQRAAERLAEQLDWGPADLDIPLRYVLSGIFSMPTGGHAALDNRVASAVLGGWAVSPVYVWQSGQSLTPATSTDLANSGATNRPNNLCPSGKGAPHTFASWFNTACFAPQAQYTCGNASKGSMRGPGQNRLDLSLQRNFGIPRWEAGQLNFRIEGLTCSTKFSMGFLT